ncbi:hypothetical protein PIIN_09996 [Serendipita indica DSM 11827]|uniref:Uncharacterized protein n=1 Tax=Serendipita indica (strain DSM 11827) TaxID=1109443 RepID=G4TXF3_SERID|nr:hypothetical protein PIIN_09996 [Serendipita indica DSM 11827]
MWQRSHAEFRVSSTDAHRHYKRRNPFQADVPWHEYFDFGPEDDDEAVVGNHEAQSLVITPVDKNELVSEYVFITHRPHLLTGSRETAAHLAEREENKKRIEEISQRYDVYLSREEPLTDSEPGFSFSESELDPPEEPNWPTESAKLRLDGWEEEPEDRPVVLDERTLQPEVSPSNSTGLDASPASGTTQNILGHDPNAVLGRDADILGGSAARRKRAPLILLAAREDNWDEPALPIGDDGYACPYASLRRLSDRLNAASGRKPLQTECYDRPFFPPTDRARINYVAGTIRCDYGGSICAQGRSAVVSMKEPCRTKVNSWESYSRHVICSHIVDGRPSTGETIDDRIIHRLRRSLVAIGDVEAASQLDLTEPRKRAGKARKGLGEMKGKGGKRKLANEDEYSEDDEYPPSAHKTSSSR